MFSGSAGLEKLDPVIHCGGGGGGEVESRRATGGRVPAMRARRIKKCVRGMGQ